MRDSKDTTQNSESRFLSEKLINLSLIFIFGGFLLFGFQNCGQKQDFASAPPHVKTTEEKKGSKLESTPILERVLPDSNLGEGFIEIQLLSLAGEAIGSCEGIQITKLNFDLSGLLVGGLEEDQLFEFSNPMPFEEALVRGATFSLQSGATLTQMFSLIQPGRYEILAGADQLLAEVWEKQGLPYKIDLDKISRLEEKKPYSLRFTGRVQYDLITVNRTCWLRLYPLSGTIYSL